MMRSLMMHSLPKPVGGILINHGDEFKDGQYRAIRALGEGRSSTVWLAVDRLNSRYVALKVLTAKSTVSAGTELSIYTRLQQAASADPLSEHVLILLDSFEHVGYNGTHRCHVFEPMGADTEYMLDRLPCNIPAWKGTFRNMDSARYPKLMAKKFLKDALSGIAFLHKNGVTHGDLQPRNLLFASRPLRSISEETEYNEYEDYHLRQNVGGDIAVKVSDLGAAFFSNDPPESTKTPLGLRAPELIFKDPFDSSIDIWAFGCLIYEFLTGETLFHLDLYDADSANNWHLVGLNDILQPISDAWMTKWPNARRYFGRNRKRLRLMTRATWDQLKQENNNDDDDSCPPILDDDSFPPLLDDKGIPLGPFMCDPLEILFDKHRPDDMDADEAKVITTLIRRILQYEPSQRPSAAELLEDPWFKN